MLLFLKLLLVIVIIIAVIRVQKRKTSKSTIQVQKLINKKEFEFIMDHTSTHENVYFKKGYSLNYNVFYYANINPIEVTDHPYLTQDLIMPRIISFYDILDKEICSIIEVNDRVEIIKPSQIANEKTPIGAIAKEIAFVKKQDIIKQAQNSFRKLVEIKKEQEKTRKREETIAKKAWDAIPLLAEKKKVAYEKLAHLCLNQTDAKKTIAYLNTLKETDDLEEYDDTIYHIDAFISENEIEFIHIYDIKFEVEDLEWSINKTLKKNFDANFSISVLPSLSPEQIIIGSRGVITAFDKALQQHGFQFAFIDSSSDYYTLMVIKSKDKQEVVECIEASGNAYGISEDYYF